MPPIRPALRAALLLMLSLTAASCDSGGTEILPLGGVLYVSLAGSGSLLLESGLDLPCAPRIATEQQTVGGRFSVSVLGVEESAGTCSDLGPAQTTIPIETGGINPLPIDLVFGGQLDAYTYRTGSGPARLDSVRSTVTRLGPRPD